MSKAGWRVTFVTGDMDASSEAGVEVVCISPGRSRRTLRMIVTAPRAIFRALKMPADVYHFHDPELIPWAWLLLLKRCPVIYDVHEDYQTSLMQKEWMPRFLRRAVASFAGWAERVGSMPFKKVIAERYYVRRFPDAVPILNYPVANPNQKKCAHSCGSSRLLYTGNVTVDRGALCMARLIAIRSELSVTTIGLCRGSIASAMRDAAGVNAINLRIHGEDHYVPFDDVAGQYAKGGWLAGLALFPDTAHYREKELTKFFEYMGAGLPIIASNFPVWRNLIEDQGVGLCVDATDPHAVGSAVDWLRLHPEEAKSMAERGQELVRTRYNWEQEGRRLLELYSRLTNVG